MPYDFYYEYKTSIEGTTYRHKIIDWEVQVLYWNCQKLYGINWETKFREKIEYQFSKKDLHFLLGTQHRFPDQWLLIGLVYPPKGEFQIPLFPDP